jgi:hypothetical protein
MADQPAPLSAPAPPRLWWVYLLVLFALAALGAGAGSALVVSEDAAQFAAVDRCAAHAGVSTSGTWSLSAGSVIVDRCGQTLGGDVARTMAIGAVLLPALSVALALVGGAAVRLRLPRTESSDSTLLAAAARFDYWCTELGLAGRRRPRIRFVSARIRPRPAFTTAIPFARADVVLPESYAYADRRDFDVAVLHELGHVKAADVSWAAAVWWSGWLPVPSLLAVILPAVTAQDWLAAWSISIVTSAVLSVAILVLRAALLRRREFAADRFAATVVADPAALAGFFGDRMLDPPAPRARAVRGVRRIRSALAVHPSTRARAAGRDDAAGEGAVTTIAGVVAMIGWQTLAMALTFWRAVARPHADVPPEVSLGLAASVWAIVVVPGWSRLARTAARDGRAVRWRGSFAGAVVGLLAGYCLPVPGMPWLISVWPTAWLPLVLALFAVFTGAVAVFTAGLVGNAAQTTGLRAALSQPIIVTAAAGTLYLVWQTASDLLHATVDRFPAAVIRLLVNGGAAVAPTTWLAPLVLSTVLITALAGTRVRPGRPAITILGGGVLVGSVFAVLSWLLRWHPSLSLDSKFLITWQKYWICVLAGLIVYAAQVIARGGRQDRLPGAIGMGTLTAVTGTLITAAAVALTSRYKDPNSLGQQVATTLWLLFVAIIVTLPWLPVLARAVARPWLGRLDHSQVTRYAGVPVAVAAVSLLLLGGLLFPVTIGPHDATIIEAFPSQFGPATSHASTTVPTPSPSTRVDPGRPLDPAQVAAVVAAAATALPAGSTPTANLTENLPITPPRCASAVALSDGIDQRPQTARLERTYSIPGAPGILRPQVIIDVVSLRDDQSLDAVIQDVVTACATFRLADADADGGHLNGLTAGAAISDRVYAQQVVTTGTVRGVIVGAISDWAGAQVGHNYVSVAGSYQFTRGLPPDEAEQYIESTVSSVFADLRAALAH